MNWFAELARRLSMLFRRQRFDTDLKEEMRLHLELRAQEKLQAGLSPHEARSAAMRRFGNPTVLRETSHAAWGWQWFERFLQDVSYGLRAMLRSPGVTAIAILSLALGIGANTAIFSLLDAVMLRSLPVQEPDRLVLFGHGRWVGSIDDLPNRSWDLFSYPFYREISQKNDVFAGVTAINSIEFGSHGSVDNGGLELISADLVSGSFFSVLGVQPFLGRILTEADDRAPSAGPVAVASYSWWKQRFGGDPSILGRTVSFGKHNYTIVGVAAPNFFGTSVGQAPDLWIPLSMEKEISPGWNGLDQRFFQSLYLIARLKPGVTLAQASANTNLLFKQILRSEYVGPQPSQKESQSIDHALIELTPATHGLSQIRSQFSVSLEILMTVVGLVLLIACANIANLLLARGTARSREIAVRMAIGATRLRLIVQLLTESLVLALLGAALGIALEWPTSHLLLRVAAGGAPVALDVSPDLRWLGFTLLLTVLTALLFGMAPAMGATRLQLTSSLRDGRGGSSAPARNRLASMLVVSQIALSVVLLTGAGLFLRSLRKLTSVDTGFDKQNVLVFQLDESSLGYQQDDPRLRNLLQQIEQHVSELPGVRTASFSFFTFNQGEESEYVTLQGIPRTPENGHETLINVVGEQFFATLGLPVLAGRSFTSQDQEKSPKVAVINETMARQFFPGMSPVGRRFGLGEDAAHSGDYQVIGVVKDAKYVALQERPHPAIYFPWVQRLQFLGNFEVRYSGDEQQIIPEVRQAIHQVNPNLPIGDVSTLSQEVDQSLGPQRLIAQLSAFFGLLAVFLVCIGIYGLMSYTVTRRTNEIGIRMALGAGRSSVLWLVMREIFVLAGVGLAIGIPCAWGGALLVEKLEDPHLLSQVLFGLGPNDPVSIIGAMALMIAVSIFAGYLPARRASRVDPNIALRYE
jgi:predicted permease